MNTLNTIEHGENEKIEIFFELLKTNPEAIESQIIKNEYKKILYKTFEDFKSGENEYAKRWYMLNLLNLLNLGKSNDILNNDEIENICREILIIVVKDIEIGQNCVNIIEELLKLNVLDKKEIKKKCEESLDANINNNPKSIRNFHILKLDIWDKGEIKEKYKGKCIDLLDRMGDIWSFWVAKYICDLLKLDIREKWEIKKMVRNLLNKALKEIKWDWSRWIIVVDILSLNILENDEIDRISNDLLDISIENANECDYYMAESVIPELLKLKTINKKSIEHKYRDLLYTILRKSESNDTDAFVVYIELLDKDILGEKEFKEKCISSLMEGFKWSEHSLDWTRAIEKVIKWNLLDKKDKELCGKLLDIAFTEIKNEWMKNDKTWCKVWLWIIIKLLDMDILNPQDKRDKYKDLILSFVLNPIDYIPWLVKSLYKEEFDNNIKIPQGVWYHPFIFLEKNKDKIDIDDVNFIGQINEILTDNEVNYLYRQDYNEFKKIERAVKWKDCQKIRGFKKQLYPKNEKEKLEKMLNYFWEWIWTYFVDKVPWDKLMKDRFRDPHNALLRTNNIIELAKQLETRWVSKEEFIKNYLWVAWDRNNWYQQLNNFLEKYRSNWKELVEWAMANEFLGDEEFLSLTEWVLEQERTGELYKNIDNMEQILTLLHMLKNKEALIKLKKLVNSEDPKDKILYEYYKWAIYHPRTKPIIMEMYENPGEFLGLDDDTFRDLKKIHQAKKPSNMVDNFEYLDFDARDLVNCLPLWIYDQLSYFKPFEMKFYIYWGKAYTKEELELKKKEEIRTFLQRANKKKISNIISKIKRDNTWDTTMWYQIRDENHEDFINKLTAKYTPTYLIDLFNSLKYSEFGGYKNIKEMTAKISPKSDPNNWFNGFNCDSLAEWHGKKVVAMFNPYCTDFCIYEWDQDPNVDNLKVTSWVTLNRAIPMNFNSLLSKIQSQTTNDISSALWNEFEDYKDPSEYVITMDNIEANPNFVSKNEIAVRKMYEKFFSEYVRQNPISPNGIPINTSKFYSWVNYNKLNILTDEVENKSLPVFVNAYTDNSGTYSLRWELDAWEQKEKVKKVWIYPLSIEDVVQVSYMEWKIYDWSSMKNHLWNLQHEITASILNNTLKWRPNLSFAWYNSEWKIWWYILAYQWKMEDWTPWIYISDFSMYEKYRWLPWGRLIYYRINQVKKYYPWMPVFTRTRERTSHAFMENVEKYWYSITQNDEIYDCWEKWHRVVMNPEK